MAPRINESFVNSGDVIVNNISYIVKDHVNHLYCRWRVTRPATRNVDISFSLCEIILIYFFAVLSMSAGADQVWIDVRTQDEYAAGHLPGALLIPHDQIAALINEHVKDKNADIQLYCRSGRRADTARDVLLKMGYTRITNHGSLENALVVAEQKKWQAEQ